MYGEHLLRNLENLGLCRQYSKTTDYKEQDGQCEEENFLQEIMRVTSRNHKEERLHVALRSHSGKI
jgi:hypothetical protein